MRNPVISIGYDPNHRSRTARGAVAHQPRQ